MKLAALWGFIGVTLAGFGAAAFVMARRPPDPFALCQHSAIEAAASTMVIVDPTDTLTDIQARRIKTTIEAERDRLPRGGRLTIVRVNAGAPWEPIELASVCNPGTEAEANPLFVTRSHIGKRWLSAFAGPIDAAIAAAASGPASSNSPLIATVAATLARPDFDVRAPQRRLVIVSDMLEHQSGGYSQLKGGDFWRSYRTSALAHTIRLDLRGVAVAIDYLIRGQYVGIQGPEHQEFWRRLFSEAGAMDVTFIGGRTPTPAPEISEGARLVERTGRN